MIQDLIYIGSVFAFLIGSAALVIFSWLAVEIVYWIWCKMKGRDY